MKTYSFTAYQFDELSETAKKRAIEAMRFNEAAAGDEWWDNVYSDATEIAKLMGINIEKIYFSGFSSQGDGAQFVGSYGYEKGSVKAVKAYAPLDETLHSIAADLAEIQKKHSYGLSATVKNDGRYCHEYDTAIEVEERNGNWVEEGVEEELKETLRSFMRWIYKQLEKEYDYLTSDEAVAEALEGSMAEFNEDGTPFRCMAA